MAAPKFGMPLRRDSISSNVACSGNAEIRIQLILAG